MEQDLNERPERLESDSRDGGGTDGVWDGPGDGGKVKETGGGGWQTQHPRVASCASAGAADE